MKATLIDVENMDYFLPAVEKEALLKSDIFLGAVEESSDTAAGVLAATATPDKMLSINYIYVEERFRRQGAGSAMIALLKDIASEAEAEAVSCDCLRSLKDEESDIEKLLVSCGFTEAESVTAILSGRVGDLSVGDYGRPQTDVEILPLSGVSSSEWMDYASDEKAWSSPPFRRDYYDGEHSYFAYKADGTRCGVLLLRCADNALIADELFTEPTEVSEDILKALAARAIADLKRDGLQDEVFYIRAGDAGEAAFAGELIGGLAQTGYGVSLSCYFI